MKSIKELIEEIKNGKSYEVDEYRKGGILSYLKQAQEYHEEQMLRSYNDWEKVTRELRREIEELKKKIHSLVQLEASGAQREDANGSGGRLPKPCATFSPDTLSKKDMKREIINGVALNYVSSDFISKADVKKAGIEIKEAFNIFIKKWCGNMYPHLIDSDENDGESFRNLVDDKLGIEAEEKG